MRGIPQIIEGVGDVDQPIRQQPSFDPTSGTLLTNEHYELYRRVDGRSTVRQVINATDLSPIRAVALIRQLFRWRAVEVSGEADDSGDDIPIDDATELGAMTPQEAALMQETVELEPWEKRRIIAFARLVRERRYLDLLGVQATASKRELKRAYYELSKEFHPDRYYGKRLGSFAGLLEVIFEAAAGAVKALSARSMGAGLPRRRIAERFVHSSPIRLQCESWSSPVSLSTYDVSDGGLFVITRLGADIGERVRFDLTLPNGGLLPLRGRVVARRGGDDVEVPGLGIEFTPLSASERVRFELILDAASRAVPRPADMPASDDASGTAVARTRIARGSGPIQRRSAVVGIDFGTTYTCVSAALGNRVTILPWADGSRAAPSVVSFPNHGQHVVGAAARDRLLFDPKHAVPAAKRLLGRRADDRTLESHLAQVPYKTGAAADGTLMVEMWGESYPVTQLCSYLIAEAREVAGRALGERVERAVFTVPVSFGADRIELLRRAAELAHVEAVEIIDEPSAAALANRYRPDFGGIIGLFDFGGGTFDFSVVDGSAGDFRVLATAGDDWLGGDDLDLAVAEAVANQYWRIHGVDMRKRAVEWQYLLFACEQAKRRLSADQLTHIFVPEVFRDAHGAHDLRMRLRRDPVEALWAAPIKRALVACIKALEPIGLHPSDLSAIYLSGGTSYVPAVRRALERNFHLPVRIGVPPEFAACLGAGIHAAQIERRGGTTLEGLKA